LESRTFGLRTVQLHKEKIKNKWTVDASWQQPVAYATYQVDRVVFEYYVLLTKSLHISQDLKSCKKLINLMQKANKFNVNKFMCKKQMHSCAKKKKFNLMR
jgi:hypothetical protein